MTPLLWLMVVIGAYVAVAVWVAAALRAVQSRNHRLLAALVAWPVIVWLAERGGSPLARVAVADVLLTVGALAIARLFRPREALLSSRQVKPVVTHLMLLTGSFVFLIPFAWLVTTSLKDDHQISHFPPQWFIWPLLWKNYPDALNFLPAESRHGLVNLENTLIIAGMSVIGTLLSSSLVAYAFARLRWPGRDWLFGVLLATMMLPDAVTMMPRFLIFRDLHWIDTLLPLWAPSFFASAFNVFLLRQFFMNVPKELEDAAKIDGCSYFGIYWHVMLPLVRPALAAVAIMTFLGAWKDFLNPLIYISSPRKMPLSYVLQLFNASHGSEPALLMAMTTMVMLPVIVLFFFTQRYFVEGISLTGMGGR